MSGSNTDIVLYFHLTIKDFNLTLNILDLIKNMLGSSQMRTCSEDL